jgi:signal transduction histidine kinase
MSEQRVAVGGERVGRGAAAGLASTLEELREYARDPSGDPGRRRLAAALNTLARRSPVPVELDVRTKARLPERVEVAAYHVAAEALANAARHANASAARVAVGAVRPSACDDGAGGADPAHGSGLAGLKTALTPSAGH